MTHTDLIARLRLYGRPMMRGGDHPQSIVCREAADALTAAQAENERLREALIRLSVYPIPRPYFGKGGADIPVAMREIARAALERKDATID